VLVAQPPGLEQMAALLAVMRIGAIAVPVPVPSVRAATGKGDDFDRLCHVARDCEARFLIARDSGRPAQDLPPPVDTRLWDDDSGPDVPMRPDRLAFLQYTSGSTQMPRGVMVGHDNLLANARATVDHDRPVAVTWLPQHHDMGLIGYYLYPQLSGGETHGFAPATFLHRPLLWLDLIDRVRASATSAPGFGFAHLIQRLADEPDGTRRYDLSCLRMMMAAAEPIPSGLAQQVRQWLGPMGLQAQAFQVAYGLAENTLAVTGGGRQTVSVSRQSLSSGVVARTRRASAVQGAVQLTSCGRPLGTNRVIVVSSDALQPLPEGAVGEVWVSGPSTCRGYWNQPTATREVFNAVACDGTGPWLRTGDTGFFDQGELVICGRSKDIIILRGENHHAHDIEQAALCGHSGGTAVAAAAAFEIRTDAGPAAVLVLGVPRGVVIDPEAAARAVRLRQGVALLAVSVVPQREVPRTTSGKVRRQRVADLWRLGRLTILSEHRATADLPAPTDVFATILTRYGYSGGEALKIGAAGFDSLDLVIILHGLQELLGAAGAAAFAESLDARLVQQVTIGQLSAFSHQVRHDPAQAALMAHGLLREMQQRETALEHAMMRRDAAQALPPARLRRPAVSARATLLTGATGFLGPFLLASLLEQTDQPVITLIRADSDTAAADRLDKSISRSDLSARLGPDWRRRVRAVAGDLEKPGFGMPQSRWDDLASETASILHNGAQVNYLFDYVRMRQANVMGTAEIIRLSRDGVCKPLNLVSTTFIFGWSTTPILREADANVAMSLLDFGYSQSKWVSETLVARLAAGGHPVRIFRPALVTPSAAGQGQALDITLRLLAFMIKHGLGISAGNQISIMPADVTAANIVAIANGGQTGSGTFHVTRDRYTTMADITDAITRQTGQSFALYPVKQFVDEVIAHCTPADPLFPLLSFLVTSADAIAAMEFKRYDNTAYRAARAASPFGQPDPDLDATVAGILTSLRHLGAM